MTGERQAASSEPVRGMVALCAAGAILTGVLFVANLLLGDVNQDEGWYLYAARLISHGRLPYVDFASTQGPVMPFAYAAAAPLIDRWGVAGGRAVTAFLGLLATAAAVALAVRMTPRRWRWSAAAVALALAGVNVYQTYFLSVVKTYALTAALLAAGYLELGAARGRRGAAHAFAAGVLIALAAGTRLSAAFAWPAAFCWLVWRARTSVRRGGGRDLRWLALAAGAAVTVAAVFGPFAWRAPRALWFALAEYHAGREVGSTAAWLAYKAGFLSRCVAAYGAAAATAAAMVLWGWFLRPGKAEEPADGAVVEPGFEAAVWGGVGLVSAIHVMAPFPYDDYQAIVYPLLAAALAARLIRVAAAGCSPSPDGAARRVRWVSLAVAAVCALEAGSSPLAWQWAIGERDRIWWPMREQSPLARLREAGRQVRALAREAGGGVVLTQDTYLAVEAGLDVPAGMELGPFCYFPDWPDDKARACRVLNRRSMEATLAGTDAPVAAFSGYGLAIRGPEVTELAPDQSAALWDLVRRRYETAGTIERFGQASTRLEILTRKK